MVGRRALFLLYSPRHPNDQSFHHLKCYWSQSQKLKSEQNLADLLLAVKFRARQWCRSFLWSLVTGSHPPMGGGWGGGRKYSLTWSPGGKRTRNARPTALMIVRYAQRLQRVFSGSPIVLLHFGHWWRPVLLGFFPVPGSMCAADEMRLRGWWPAWRARLSLCGAACVWDGGTRWAVVFPRASFSLNCWASLCLSELDKVMEKVRLWLGAGREA